MSLMRIVTKAGQRMLRRREQRARRRACRRRFRMESLENRNLMAILTVTNLEDGTLGQLAGDGQLSLREAIHAANTNTSVDGSVPGDPGLDTIAFEAGLSGFIRLNDASLDVTEALHLIGPGTSILTIDGGTTNTRTGAREILNVTNADVNIEGVLFFQAENGLLVNGGASVALTDVEFRSNKFYGVHLQDSGDVVLTNVVTTLNGRAGVLVDGANSFVETDGHHFLNDDGGVELRDIAGDAMFTRTTLENNDRDDNGIGTGIATIGFAPTIGGNLVIRGATIRDTDGAGPLYHQDTGISLRAVAGLVAIESDPDQGASTQVSGHADVGIDLTNMGAIHLSRVDVSGNEYGIEVRGATSVTIDGASSISNNLEDGAFFSMIADFVSVIGVTMDGNGGDGLSFFQAPSVTITGPASFSHNGNDGISASSNGGVLSIVGIMASGNADAGVSIGSPGTVTVDSSTFNNNRYSGIESRASLIVNNSTISGNESPFFGGGINVAYENDLHLTVNNSTIVGNRANSDGGGIRFQSNGGSVEIHSSIVAGNSRGAPDADAPSDLSGDFAAASNFNLIGTGEGATGITGGANGNQVGTTLSPIDPQLGPLADNGGPTRTHALLSGSPAIDAGSNPLNLAFDQRGDGFARSQGPATDVGSFERVARIPQPVVYVDDDFAGTPLGDDPDGAGPATEFGVDAFASIQEGVDTVIPTGIVHIYPGDYPENVTINKDVMLDGTSGDANDVVIDPAAGDGISISTGNVVIRDVTVQDAEHGIRHDGGGDLTLNNARIVNNAENGIDGLAAGNIDLTELHATGNGLTGVGIQNVQGNVRIVGGDFSNNGDDGAEFSVVNGAVHVEGAAIANNFDDGLRLLSVTGEVHVTDPVVDNNGDDGLLISGQVGDVAITGGSYELNGEDGVDIEGIEGSVSISAATFSRNGDDGVEIDLITGDVEISGGSFSNNGQHGLEIVDADGSVSLSNANVELNGDNGVDINGAGPLSVAGGVFLGNVGDGIEVDNAGTVTLSDLTVEQNGRDGVELRTIGDILVTGAKVDENGGHGLRSDSRLGTTTILGGSFSDNASEGIDFGSVRGGAVQLTDVTADNNGNQGVTFGSFGYTANILRGSFSGNDNEGIRAVGGFSVEGVLTVTDASVDRNRSTGLRVSDATSVRVQGGSFSHNDRPGSTIRGIELTDISGDVTLTHTTVDGNSGVGVIAGGTNLVRVDSSTISNNGASGVEITSGSLEVVNSTVSGNRAVSSGGGIFFNVGALNGGTLTVFNSTITGNRADSDGDGSGDGGGIAVLGSTSPPMLRSTIVAGNVRGPIGSDVPSDLSGDFDAASAFNLIGSGDGSSGLVDGVNGNQVGTAGALIDPRLGPLTDSGGPTRTHALLAGSPAIEAGNSSAGIQFDQRGAGFPRIQGATADIGAFEAEPPVNGPPVAEPQNVATPEDTALAITLSGDDGDPRAVQTLTFAIESGPTSGALSGFNPATGEVVYTPDVGYNGPDSFTFTVTDDDTVGGPALTSAPATVQINVTPVNDDPTAPIDVDSAINQIAEDAATGTGVGITASASDVDSPSLSYRLTDDAGGRFTIDPISGVVSVADGSLLDGPATHSISVEAADGQGGLSTADFDVTVTNVAPSVAADNASVAVNEGQSATNSGTYADPGMDSVSLSASAGTIVDNGDGTWSWSLATTGGGDSQSVTITATDSDGAVSTTSFSLVVNNVAPMLSAANSTVTVAEGETAGNSGTYNDSSAGPITLTASVGHITDNGDGTWSWTFAASDGPDQSQVVTITATDGDGASSSASFSLVVENAEPSVAADHAAVTVDEFQTAGNTGTYGDPSADAVSLSASAGTIVDNGDGTWSWSLDTSSPADSRTITVTATDSDGGVSTVEFDVQVRSVEPQVTLAVLPGTIDEGQSVVLSGQIVNSPQEHTVTVSWGDGRSDSLTLSPGAASFVLDHAYEDDNPSGTPTDVYSVQVTVTDAAGDQVVDGSQSVTVHNISPVFTSLSLSSAAVPVDGAAVLSGTYVDPGGRDTFSLDVDWDGDGQFDVSIPVSGGAFAVGHTFGGPVGTHEVHARLRDDDGGMTSRSSGTLEVTVVARQGTTVLESRLYYNNSAFDGNDSAAGAADVDAIDPTKVPLAIGQTATFANISGYTRGINGVTFLVDGLPDDGANLTAADFAVRLGTTDDVNAWAAGPTPTVTLLPNSGPGGADRILLTFPDNAIQDTYAAFEMLATPNTGLTVPHVAIFGNVRAETGAALIAQSDSFGRGAGDLQEMSLSGVLFEPAGVDSVSDINKDGVTDAFDFLDLATAGLNQNVLPTISPQVGASGAAGAAAPLPLTAADVDASSAAAKDAALAQLMLSRLHSPFPRLPDANSNSPQVAKAFAIRSLT